MSKQKAIRILTEIRDEAGASESAVCYVSCEEDIEAIDMAIEALQDDWIPVSAGLPEEKGTYLVTYHPCYWDDVSEDLCVGIDTFRGKAKWAKEKYQRIIAWKPLPEPYEGKEQENDKND